MKNATILVLSDFIKEKVEVFDNGQTIVYYKTKPWQFSKGCIIDLLVLVGYTWEELDWDIKLCIAPMLSSGLQGIPTYKMNNIIEI